MIGCIGYGIDGGNQVAIGRVVLTSREHVIALEPRGKGLMGTLLRYPYEVRDESDYFDDIPSAHVTKDMLDLAKHIVETKSGHFNPEKFEDHYENALKELLKKKQAGEEIHAEKPREPAKVINLMDALRRSVEGDGGGRAQPKRAAARGKATTRTSGAKRRKAG
jgi:DNA end-binding protein Ku